LKPFTTRRHQFAALFCHVAAKEWLYFRRCFKQAVIEEGGGLVRDWSKPGEALLDEFDLRRCHLLVHFFFSRGLTLGPVVTRRPMI
jgi:hypothetical protein